MSFSFIKDVDYDALMNPTATSLARSLLNLDDRDIAIMPSDDEPFEFDPAKEAHHLRQVL